MYICKWHLSYSGKLLWDKFLVNQAKISKVRMNHIFMYKFYKTKFAKILSCQNILHHDAVTMKYVQEAWPIGIGGLLVFVRLSGRVSRHHCHAYSGILHRKHVSLDY